jgi:hypothetical protein
MGLTVSYLTQRVTVRYAGGREQSHRLKLCEALKAQAYAAWIAKQIWRNYLTFA